MLEDFDKSARMNRAARNLYAAATGVMCQALLPFWTGALAALGIVVVVNVMAIAWVACTDRTEGPR